MTADDEQTNDDTAEAEKSPTPRAWQVPMSPEERRRNIEELADMMRRLAAVPLPPLTEEEVEAEIQAVRAARRKAQGQDDAR